jgi:hypothetical protein
VSILLSALYLNWAPCSWAVDLNLNALFAAGGKKPSTFFIVKWQKLLLSPLVLNGSARVGDKKRAEFFKALPSSIVDDGESYFLIITN